MQARFVIIDKDACGYVHCIDEAQAFRDLARSQDFLYFGRDVDKGPARGRFKPELLTVEFHAGKLK
jgi:hypothetical protein